MKTPIITQLSQDLSEPESAITEITIDGNQIDFKVYNTWYYADLTKTGKIKAHSIRLNREMRYAR